MTDTETKRAQKPRDVEYTLEIVDDIPDLEVQRRSPLEDQLKRIIDTPPAHGKFVRMASYANGSAASAAANTLRKKHGDIEAVEGWTIRPKRVDTEIERDGQMVTEPRTVLFARYNPEAIVPGAREDFDVRMKEREAKTATRKAERETLKNSVDESVAKRSTTKK